MTVVETGQGTAGNGERSVGICVADRVLLGYANQGARDGRLGRRKLRSKVQPASLQESCHFGIPSRALMSTVVTISTPGYLLNPHEHSGNSKYRWIPAEHS